MKVATAAAIPYGRQDINEEDIQSVVSVLKSDFLTQGPQVPKFERTIIEHCGSNFAVAVNSATSALHIACLALGVGPGDRVWTSPNTFVASANCALFCGADVDFVDIESKTYNICPQLLEKKLELAKRTATLPKLVIPVHFAGQPCDMEKIHQLSKKYGFHVIEDASHAIGAKYSENGIVGDCRFSDITVFSFHPVKIITTVEGGVATTNSSEFARKMQLLRSHGITRESEELVCGTEGPWYYEQQLLGFNYRMTDVQAALGVSQMLRLEHFLSRRHQLAFEYDRLLSGLPLNPPYRPKNSFSSLHLYPIVLWNTESRLRVFSSMRSSGIHVNVHYIPVHTQPYYQSKGFKHGDFPNSENYYAGAISLPLYPGMTDDDQQRVVYSLSRALQ